MNLVDASVKADDTHPPPAAAEPQPPSQASPSTDDAAEDAPSAAGEERSIKKRAWDKASRFACILKIASHVASVGELLEQNEGDFHVEFANDAIRVFQGIISGGCISGPLLSNLNNFCCTHAAADDAGTQALLLLGRSLRKAAETRNEEITTADGLKVGKYGLPELLAPRPPMPRTASETPEQMDEWFGYNPDHYEPLFQEREIKQEIVEDDSSWLDYLGNPDNWENTAITHGKYIGENASYVDLSLVPPLVFEDLRPVGHVSELRMTERRMPSDKPRPLNAPYKPYEYKVDEAGNPLVKSEMMGEDEFYDNQIAQRKVGLRYLEISKRGLYEDRFIMRHIGTGTYERKRYECEYCGIISANQHKFASHVRHAHPKTQQERAEIAKLKAERAAELKEEKKRRLALMPIVEREKRERKTALARRSSGANLTQSTNGTPNTPATDKIYICPICKEEVASQHVFASHMRYNHPKDGTTTSMAGRRATVKRVAKDEAIDQPVAIDTPESALQALSTVLSASKMTPPTIRRTKTLPDGTGAYKCRVCGRCFDNLNACAGHTRHCIAAHNAAPSPPKPIVQKAAPPPPKIEVEIEEDDEEEEEDQTAAEDADGCYRCRVCNKPFNNPNSVAGHTRHCLALNGGEPSPRALARRKAKSQPMPTYIIKTEPLPMSPLAAKPSSSTVVKASASTTASSSAADAEVARHLRSKKSAAPSAPAAATPAAPVKTVKQELPKAVKPESVDDAPPPPKPVGRTTRNSAATALEVQPAAFEYPAVVETPATVSGRRPTRSSMVAPTAADAAAAVVQNGTVSSTPSSSRVMSTRSSRSSVRLMSETASDAPSATPLPPPAKRTRNSLGNLDSDIKKELAEEDEDLKTVKQEPQDEDLTGSPKKRLSKGDKKSALTANRGFDTEAARTCYYCHLRLNTFHAGDRHIRMNHAGREQIYACSSCKAPFLTLGGLENHWTKGEHCPDGTVMVAGQCIFELEKEVLLRPEEVKLNGLPLGGDHVEDEKSSVKKDEKKLDKPVEKKEEKKVEKPIEKKEEKKVEKPAEKKEEKKVEKPVEKRLERPVEKKEEKKVEKPAEKKVDKPAEKKEEKKVEKPVEKRLEKPVERKEEKKVEKPAEKKVDKPAEKKEEVKVEKPVEKRLEKPAEKKEEKRLEKHVEKRLEKPAEKKEEKKVEKPVEKKEDNNIDKLIEKKEEKKEEKNVEKKVEKPSQKRSETPSQKKQDKKEETRTEKRKADKSEIKKEENTDATDQTSAKPAKRARTRDTSNESDSSRRPGSSTPVVISLAIGRSGANRPRKAANRFDPTPTTPGYSTSK